MTAAVAERILPAVAPVVNRRFSIQRRFALVTVLVPTLGFAVAVALAIRSGIHPVEWALLGIMYVVTGLGVEAGLHRYFSHRSFVGNRFVTYWLGITGSMAAQGPVIFWASIHRQHHATTDVEGDPHSPWLGGKGALGRIRGLVHAHLGWLLKYDQTDWSQQSMDLLKDRDIVRINAAYPFYVLLGLAIPALAGMAVLGPEGLWRGALWGGLVRIFLWDHMTWGVNSLCHTLGARPFKTRNKSTNIGVLALPTLGGSWHHNHHTFPSSAKNNLKFHQIDPSGIFISLLQLTGLVTSARRPSQRSIDILRKRGGHD
jgi:stearoyl-CoA desaturase (Delta-9 desaturase)